MSDQLDHKWRLMTKSRVAFGMWLLVWALILIIGIRLYLGVVAQKVPGYPTSGQFELCIVFPCLLLLLNALFILFSRRLPVALRLVAFFVQFLALPAFFLFVSGGV
ncbi:hypothetical protein ADT25_02275 [Xanthomonas oryzae]|uniref:Uncharacterized protein n=1 Tax=Xanthomonas oryzae TaxID=347 RepID=A0AAP0ZP54_9XANT|nr:hypothetical protein [Xanthomonas oryzae]KOR48820.1 hypothetical protein ADT25_02275 [Xanthomonas oryzae]QBG85697.1 hypothetical protein EYR27_20315 [Xanthomonas oryzae]